MKSNNQPTMFFSPFLGMSVKQQAQIKKSEHSPYLRAVLSDRRSSSQAKVFSMTNSSMAAALRYIAKHK